MRLFYFLLFVLFGCQKTPVPKDILLLSKFDFNNSLQTNDQCGVVYDTLYIRIQNLSEDTIYLDRYGEGTQRCLTESKVIHYSIVDDSIVKPYSIGINDFFGIHFYDTIPPGKSNHYLIDSTVISSRIHYDREIQMSEFLYSYKRAGFMDPEYFKLLVLKEKEKIKQADFYLPDDFTEFVLPLSKE